MSARGSDSPDSAGEPECKLVEYMKRCERAAGVRIVANLGRVARKGQKGGGAPSHPLGHAKDCLSPKSEPATRSAVDMTGQLESKHFFRAGDQVRSTDGRAGRVSEAWALYAAIEWDDGGREEVDQFTESVFVEQRAQ